MNARAVCSWLSAILAFVAALLWFKSATVRVPFPRPPQIEGPDMVVNGLSFVGTATAQTTWSRRAAMAAAAAAIFQGIATLL
jgi:hypothetical protein